MTETEFDEKISDSDYERYCNGNLYYCYHFRKAEEKTKALKKRHTCMTERKMRELVFGKTKKKRK